MKKVVKLSHLSRDREKWEASGSTRKTGNGQMGGVKAGPNLTNGQ